MDDSQFATNLQALMDMGFSETSALESLSFNNDIDSAIQFLFNKSQSMPDPNSILYNPNNAPGPNYLPPPIQSIQIPPRTYNTHEVGGGLPKPTFQSSYNPNLAPNNVNVFQPNIPNAIPKSISVNNYNRGYPQNYNLPPQPPMVYPPALNNQILNPGMPKPQPFSQNFQPMPIPNQFASLPPPPKLFVPNNFNNNCAIPNPIQVNPQNTQMPPKIGLPPQISFPSIPPFQNVGPPLKPGNNNFGPFIPQNEDFIEFLKNALEARGTPIELIQEILSSCSSKEEALLILGIPISLKDKPLHEIPVQFLKNEGLNDSFKEDIISELVREGATVEEAYLLSASCDNLPQALQLYYDKIDSMPAPQNNIPPPPIINKPLNYMPVPKPYLKKNPFPIPPMPVSMQNKKIPNLGGLSNFYPNIGGMNSFDSDEDMYSIISSKNKNSTIVLSSPSESDPVAPDLKTEYFERLKDFRLIMTENQGAFSSFAHGNISSSSPQALKRINNEIKTLQGSVPCDSTASIFVMIDTECMHRIKFLLSGTMDTPYAHGLYLFDVLLPVNYPQTPPKVSIITTGNGKMRFNPNLYSNGYVCLSIINTWSGRPEEQWNPSSSSLLQVMLSIQSLVMDNDILQKEPSFHSMPRNSPENIGYQQEVMYGNMKYAMIEMIKNPPIGMEEIVRTHFRIKKNEILATTKSWVDSIKVAKRINNGTQNHGINAEINRVKPENAFTEAYNELENILKSI